MGYCWIEIKYCNIVCEGVGHTKGSGPLVKGSACEVINSSASVGRDSAGLSLKRTLHTYIAILILAIYMYGIATFFIWVLLLPDGLLLFLRELIWTGVAMDEIKPQSLN